MCCLDNLSEALLDLVYDYPLKMQTSVVVFEHVTGVLLFERVEVCTVSVMTAC